jgi:hypothetical protein
MLVGWLIFAGIAILCIVVGATVMRRNRAYGNSDVRDDDFDFDKYEGFEKLIASGWQLPLTLRGSPEDLLVRRWQEHSLSGNLARRLMSALRSLRLAQVSSRSWLRSQSPGRERGR